MKICPYCSKEFKCSNPLSDCWCQALPGLTLVQNPYQDCLCPNCLNALIINNEKIKISEALIEGDDYYLKDTYMVFTEKYHLKRGYCCKNNCKHCPYGPVTNS